MREEYRVRMNEEVKREGRDGGPVERLKSREGRKEVRG